MQNQQKDRELIKIAQTNKDYSIQNFHGPDKKCSLICKIRKIVIPKQFEKQSGTIMYYATLEKHIQS